MENVFFLAIIDFCQFFQLIISETAYIFNLVLFF